MRRPTTSADRVPITATDTETTLFVSGLKWWSGRKRAANMVIKALANRIMMMIAVTGTEFMVWWIPPPPGGWGGGGGFWGWGGG
jgi:hypothetical protein